MEVKKRKPHESPFFVRQAGLLYGEEHGAIVGFDDSAAADADVKERNGRALEMGLTARYEFCANLDAAS